MSNEFLNKFQDSLLSALCGALCGHPMLKPSPSYISTIKRWSVLLLWFQCFRQLSLWFTRGLLWQKSRSFLSFISLVSFGDSAASPSGVSNSAPSSQAWAPWRLAALHSHMDGGSRSEHAFTGKREKRATAINMSSYNVYMPKFHGKVTIKWLCSSCLPLPPS